MNQKQEIKKQLKKLLQSEAEILYRLAIDTATPIEELNYVVNKIFEMSNLILRLNKTLEEIRKNEN
jgi:hypothetical protein